MEITPETPISALVREVPAAIAVLQKQGVAFCCTGTTPLSDACAHHGIAPERLVADIKRARARQTPVLAGDAPIAAVIAHIQEHYHQPLREELPRISAMLSKLVQRHGQRLPDLLPPLQATFERFRADLVLHMAKEDQGLFPALAKLDADRPGSHPARHWIHNPIEMLEAEHDVAASALDRMRTLTGSYMPPEDACPTFRGAYYALAEVERDMREHMHLENDILFPRALALARGREGRA